MLFTSPAAGHRKRKEPRNGSALAGCFLFPPDASSYHGYSKRLNTETVAHGCAFAGGNFLLKPHNASTGRLGVGLRPVISPESRSWVVSHCGRTNLPMPRSELRFRAQANQAQAPGLGRTLSRASRQVPSPPRAAETKTYAKIGFVPRLAVQSKLGHIVKPHHAGLVNYACDNRRT